MKMKDLVAFTAAAFLGIGSAVYAQSGGEGSGGGGSTAGGSAGASGGGSGNAGGGTTSGNSGLTNSGSASGATSSSSQCARLSGSERQNCLNRQPPSSAASGANGYSSTTGSSVGSASGGRP